MLGLVLDTVLPCVGVTSQLILGFCAVGVPLDLVRLMLLRFIVVVMIGIPMIKCVDAVIGVVELSACC